MKKKRKLKLIVILIFLVSALFLIQSASALTANSSNYSVSMFGTGMATGNPSSANYNSTILSESKGTARNAESSSLTANIGFFENTIYYRTVSITSYSISPRSATIGSTIGLYISALNYQSVWAKITSPNNQIQTLTLVNNQYVYFLPSPSVVGRYNVIFYANSSTGAITSVVDYFDLTEQTTPTPQPSSRGGGTTTIIEKCTYIWDCTPWSICSEGKHKRECRNIGACTGTEGKPSEEINCSEALFDISIKLKEIKLTENKTLSFDIDLTEKTGIEKIDVYIKYSIIDKNNTEIFSQIETKAIKGDLSYQRGLEEIKLAEGEYTLRVDILYGYLQRAFAEQKFKITKEGEIEIPEEKPSISGILNKNKNYILIILLTLIFILFLIPRLLIFIKDLRTKPEYLKKLKTRFFIIGVLVLLILFIAFLKLNILGGIIGIINIEKISRWFVGLLVILFFIGIFYLIIYILKIKKEKSHVIKFPSKTKPTIQENRVSSLIKKEIYSESGDKIGKINNIYLQENKIYGLMIKVNKKLSKKIKKITVDYKHVKSVSDVVIIEERVLDYLKKNHKSDVV